MNCGYACKGATIKADTRNPDPRDKAVHAVSDTLVTTRARHTSEPRATAILRLLPRLRYPPQWTLSLAAIAPPPPEGTTPTRPALVLAQRAVRWGRDARCATGIRREGHLQKCETTRAWDVSVYIAMSYSLLPGSKQQKRAHSIRAFLVMDLM